MWTLWPQVSKNSTHGTFSLRIVIPKIPRWINIEMTDGWNSTQLIPTVCSQNAFGRLQPETYHAFFLIETTYEGEHNASAVQIRRQAYWAILCGATGRVMGNRPIWLFDPDWQTAIDATGSQDMARLKELFTYRPWYDLVPDEKHEVVVDGLGEFRGLDYFAAAARLMVAPLSHICRPVEASRST